MSTTLSAREREIIMMACECFKYPVQVDFSKLAELANYKTAASANTCYISARKKMLSGGSTKLTARDQEIMALAWHCFKTRPDVDYHKLREKGNFKTVASANTVFLAARKKLLSSVKSGDGDETAPPPTKKRRISKKSTPVAPAHNTTEAAFDSDDEETNARVTGQVDEEPVDGLLFSTTKDFLEEEVKVKDEPEEAE